MLELSLELKRKEKVIQVPWPQEPQTDDESSAGYCNPGKGMLIETFTTQYANIKEDSVSGCYTLPVP